MRDDYGSVRIDIPCSPRGRVGPEPTFAERERSWSRFDKDYVDACRKMYWDSYEAEEKDADRHAIAMRSEGAD